MLKKVIVCFASATLMAALPVVALAQELKEINFGIISTESSQNLKSDWQPVLDDMAKKLGMKVNGFLPRTTLASSKACASTRFT